MSEICEWLRRLAARRRGAFGEEGMQGCRYEEAADEIERLRAALSRSEWRDEQVKALVDAMDQLLDDMGPDGQSVCLAAKAKARIAFEPFLDPDCAEFVMSLREAQCIVAAIS